MPQRIVETTALMRPIAHFSHAARVGDTIWVGATAGTDGARRLAGERPGVPDVAAQTRRMFDNLETTLGLLGAGWADLVQVKTFLVDPRDIGAYRQVARERFGAAGPSHAVAGAWHFPLPHAVVELDAVAVAGGAAPIRAELPDIAPLPSGGPNGGLLKGGQLFVTAVPIDLEGRFDGSVAAQCDRVFIHLGRALAAQGLAGSDLVRLHVTLADPRFGPAFDEATRRHLRPPFPARTVTAGALEEAGWRVTVEALAVRGGGRPVGAPAAAIPASPAMAVGDVLYTSGVTGLAAGTDPEAQAHAAWQGVADLLAEGGFPADGIVRTNNVLTHWGDFPAFNRAYGPRVAWPYPPRTTVLGGLADPLARVQIEAIAHRGAGEAAIVQVPADEAGGERP